MTYHDYKIFMKNRERIISINRSNRLKHLPLLPVPEKIDCPKVPVAYSRIDNSYMGRLFDLADCPHDCYVRFEKALY